MTLDPFPALIECQLETGLLLRPPSPARLFEVSLAGDGYVGGDGCADWRPFSEIVRSRAARARDPGRVTARYLAERGTCLCELETEFEVTARHTLRIRLWAVPYQRVQEPFVLRVSFPFMEALAFIGRAEGLQALVPAANASAGTCGEVTLFSRLTGGGLDGCVPFALWRHPRGGALLARIADGAFDPAKDVVGSGSAAGSYQVTIPPFGGPRVCLVSLEIAFFDGGWPAVFERWSEPFRRNWDRREYERPEQRWYRRCFVGHFLFCFGEDLYDEQRGRYRTEEYVQRLIEKFGGCDFFIYWHTFPRLGIDARSQFDLLDDLPGGRGAVRALFDDARRQGIRPFIQYIPWDTANGSEDHPARLAQAVRDVGADGVFLDTIDAIHPRFREELDAVRPEVVLQGEMRPTLTPEMTTYSRSTGSWAQRSPTDMPTLDLVRFAVPHHKIFLVHREARERRSQIHSAFFNGEGLVLWDRDFAIPAFNGDAANTYSEEDAALVRTYQSAWKAHADAYDTDRPEPLILTSGPHLYANRFPISAKRVIHVFNASRELHDGPLLEEDLGPEWHYVDWLGRRELAIGKTDGGRTVRGRIPAGELLCVVAFRRALEVSQGDGQIVVRAHGDLPQQVTLQAFDAAGRALGAVSTRQTTEGREWGVPRMSGGTDDLWLELGAEGNVLDAVRLGR